MKGKHINFLLFTGIVLSMIIGGVLNQNRKALAESSYSAENNVVVEGSVYDKDGQLITDTFTSVVASQDIAEDGGPGGEMYFSAVDKNGRYHLEMPAGYYYLYFRFHNRAEGYAYLITKNSVIDIRLGYSFYQISGKIYLNKKPYCNGKIQLQRIEDDPSTSWDDSYIEVETDKNGNYFLGFLKGIDGDFSVQYMVKGKMYNTKQNVMIPGDNQSGYDIVITGDVDQPSSQPQSTPKPDTEKKNPVLKKGSTFKNNNLVYKVLAVSGKKGKTAVLKAADKKHSEVVIPEVVKKNGISFEVVEIKKKAFYKHNKMVCVTIGANIKIVGRQAFYQNKKLKKIIFKTKKLEKIGEKAFIGIDNNARIIVPKSCKKKYVKLLDGKY